MQKEKKERKAIANYLCIAGFVLGILAQLVGIAGFAGLAAVCVSLLAMWQASREVKSGMAPCTKRWMAIAGLILGSVSTILCMLEAEAIRFLAQ